MKPDVMDMLRVANPLPLALSYEEERVHDQVERITDGSTEPSEITLLDRPRKVRPRRRSVPLAAAAVVLCVGGGAVLTRHHNAAGGSNSVSCQVAATGSSSVSDRLITAQDVISRRVQAAGGRAESFHSDRSARRISFTAHGIDRVEAAGACTATTFAIQALVAAPVPVTTAGTRSGNPLAGLGVAVPTTEYAYSSLSGAERARLAAATARFDCSTSREAPTLACGVVRGRTVVYLLSPAVVTGKNVTAAGASAASVAASAQWTVQLVFDPRAAAAINDLTTAHHSSASNVPVSKCPSPGLGPNRPPVSCSDFLALTVDGRVRYAPQTRAVIAGTMDVSSAGLTLAAATALVVDVDAAGAGLSQVR